MATRVQENSLAGNIYKKKIAETVRQSGLTNIHVPYVFQVLSIVSTFNSYFCQNHYITEN